MESYKQLLIYYFSGTGNILLASRQIAEIAETKGIKAELKPIDRLKKIKLPPAEGKRMVGIGYPTHGFSLPWIMLKFILRFPRGKGTDLFIVNTRAGMKMSRIFVRGLSGIAIHLPLLIFWLKGYHVRGILPLDLPSNWISLHPGLKEKVVNSIFEKRKKEIVVFLDLLFSGKRYYAPWYFFEIPLDILVSPISVGYFVYGRFFLSKTFIASSDCDKCRLCEMKCPTGSITIKDNRPYWAFTCESCMRCINICPEKAIQCSHSAAVYIGFVSASIPIGFWLNDFFTQQITENEFFGKSLVIFPFQWVLTISVFFVCYLVLHFVLRIKAINKLFTFTSLTRFWRRYRAPGINPADFVVPKAKSNIE